MRFEILGPLRVRVGERDLPLGPPQQRRLLAMLLAEPAGLPAERLIDELWEGSPPRSARHLVEVYVSNLRTVLAGDDPGPRIRHELGRYVLEVRPEESDARDFELRSIAGRSRLRHDPAAAHDALCSAERLWRGSPFEGLADGSPLLEAHAERWSAMHLETVADRVAADLALGRHVALLPELALLTAEHPFAEHLWHDRMLALYRAGRAAEAMQVSHELRVLLAAELGVDPSPMISGLEGRILAQDASLLWPEPGAPATLPVPLTSFEGRVRELAELTALVAGQRMVTLVGPAGIGKSRLAIEAARMAWSGFPDGAWWIDLAPLDDAAALLPTLARALGVSGLDGDLLEVVCRRLAGKRALLVLDNCERLTASVGEALARILVAAPTVHAIATSRSPLHVAGEQIWPVPGMGWSEGGSSLTDAGTAEGLGDGVRLFEVRARSADPGYSSDPQSRQAVTELCRRLDGLPLAIEMAASRTPTFSAGELVARLDQRLALLRATTVGVPERHRSLEAALDWTYEQLPPQAQRAFDRASVLVGGFDLAAAACVACGTDDALAAAQTLAALQEVSLVAAHGADPDGFRMLESIRTYGRAHLVAAGELEEAQRAHSRHFLSRAARAGARFGTPAFADDVRRLRRCYPDLRAALSWSLAHEPRTVSLRAARGLFGFWYRTGDRLEAETWSTLMLDGSGDAPDQLQADAHLCAAFGCNLVSRAAEGIRHAEMAIGLSQSAGDDRGLSLAHWSRALLSLQLGDFAAGSEHCRAAMAACQRGGDRWGRAAPLATSAMLLLFSGGDLGIARVMAEEALTLHRELGDIPGQSVLNPLALLALRAGDLPAAQRFAGEMVEVATGTGWEAVSLSAYVDTLIPAGALAAAQAAADRHMRSALDAGLENHFRMAVRNQALLASRRGDARRAATLLGGSQRNMPAYGVRPEVQAEVRSHCQEVLGAGIAEACERWGRSMTQAELLEVALGRAEH